MLLHVTICISVAILSSTTIFSAAAGTLGSEVDLGFRAYCTMLGLSEADCEAKFNGVTLDDTGKLVEDLSGTFQMGGVVARKAANECIRRANLQDNTALMKMFDEPFKHQSQIASAEAASVSHGEIPRPTDGRWYSDEVRFQAHWKAYVEESRRLMEMRKIDHSGNSGIVGVEPGDAASGQGGAAVKLLTNLFNEHLAWERSEWAAREPWRLGFEPDMSREQWPVPPIPNGNDIFDLVGGLHQSPSAGGSSGAPVSGGALGPGGQPGGQGGESLGGSFKPFDDHDLQAIPDDVGSGSSGPTSDTPKDTDTGSEKDGDKDEDKDKNTNKESGGGDGNNLKPGEATFAQPDSVNPDIIDFHPGIEGIITVTPALEELGGLAFMQECQMEVETELWQSLGSLEIEPDSRPKPTSTREEAEFLLSVGICDPQFFDAETCRKFADRPVQDFANPDLMALPAGQGQDLFTSTCPSNIFASVDCQRAQVEMQKQFHFNQMGMQILSKLSTPGSALSWLPPLDSNFFLNDPSRNDHLRVNSDGSESSSGSTQPLAVTSENAVPIIPDLRRPQPLGTLNRGGPHGEPGKRVSPRDLNGAMEARRFSPTGTHTLPAIAPTVEISRKTDQSADSRSVAEAGYASSAGGHDEL